ncbi:MAG TPA: ACP S-malonyltransferase [Paucimonas sp.]|nr:ACP S-malonyltransferase [Paucimonas sp.]
MKIYMFPGQGSQSKGMGGDLFDRFKEWTDKADSILGYSIKELCLEDPRNELGKTQFTQPALYVVNALSYFRKIEDTGVMPDFVAGHSLGEFDALLVAQCFDFETGLKLVQKRGELMGQVSNGAMAAVMNSSKQEIEEKLKANGLANVYLANYNTPSQIVLSGAYDEIAAAEKIFQGGKVRYYPLATSGAFHSAFMRDAMTQFKEFIKGFRFAEPKIPVMSNVTARPYKSETMLETLSDQIASTVRWSESMQYLLALGASKGEEVEFEELGNGDVLTRMAFTIKAQTPESVLQEIIRKEKALSEPKAEEKAEEKAGKEAAEKFDHSIIVELTDVREKVAAWNRAYSIGTKVKSTVADYGDLETRTDAVVLFGHRAAVYMKGYNGYFDLNELTPA